LLIISPYSILEQTSFWTVLFWDTGILLVGPMINQGLTPFQEFFKPKLALLISLREVSKYVKERIEKIGCVVFDKIYPQSEEIKNLAEFISKSF